MGATNFQLLREFVAHKQMAWCCWLEDKQPPVCFLQCSTAVTDFHFLLLAYGEPELQSFINTLGLLANKRRRVQRACWPITSSVAVWSRGRMRQPVRRRLNSLASDFSDRFSGRICCTFTMMASPVTEFARRFCFYLGEVQKSRTRGRFVVLLEETEALRCGWNDNGSSRFRHVLQEVLPKGPWGATGT